MNGCIIGESLFQRVAIEKYFTSIPFQLQCVKILYQIEIHFGETTSSVILFYIHLSAMANNPHIVVIRGFNQYLSIS